MATSSSSTALSLYEKYTQLNQQLDQTREKRGVLQKSIEDIRERLEQYETHDKLSLAESTQQAREEATHWQSQVGVYMQELNALQTQRDDLVRSRDDLLQDSLARQAKHRMECRNFLAESRTFRQRQCPQLNLQLVMLSSNDDTQVTRVDVATRLRAVALANGWDANELPDDDTVRHSKKLATNPLEGLKVSSTVEEIDLELWDTAFDNDEVVDDDDIRQKLTEYKKERQLYDTSKQAVQSAQETFDSEVNEKHQACSRRKQQLESKLQRLLKEIQQLEVEISTTLAARDMERDEKQQEQEQVITTSERVTTTAPTDSRPRAPLSPSNEGTPNPYRRRSSREGDKSLNARSRSATRQPRPPPQPVVSTPVPPPTSTRPRHSNSRKRKSTFGSSMEIGGAEAYRSTNSASASSTNLNNAPSILGDTEDSVEDNELLSFSPFQRKH